jgi:hypothetical protein
VTLAEKEGKQVKLLVVPGGEPIEALVRTAHRRQSARIVIGASPKMDASEQGMQAGAEWEKLPHPRPALSLEIVPDDGSKPTYFDLGPHPPRLWPQDVELVHKLWLELSSTGPKHKLHHRDVVGLALQRLDVQLHGREREEVLSALYSVTGQVLPGPSPATGRPGGR